MTTRREFLAGVVAAAILPRVAAADETPPKPARWTALYQYAPNTCHVGWSSTLPLAPYRRITIDHQWIGSWCIIGPDAHGQCEAWVGANVDITPLVGPTTEVVRWRGIGPVAHLTATAP